MRVEDLKRLLKKKPRIFSYTLAVWFLLCCAWANGTSRILPDYVFDSIHVNDFAVDAECNLYLVGRKESAKTYRRFAVEKYDRNGKKCWDNIYEVLPEGFGNAGIVELDHHGNIYVAGTTAIRNKTSIEKLKLTVALVKYSPDGKILWDTIIKKPGYQLELEDLNIMPDSSVCLRIASTIESESIPEESSYSYKAMVFNSDGKKIREIMFSEWPSRSVPIGKLSLCVAELASHSTGDLNSFDDFTGEYNYSVHSIIKYDQEGNRSVLLKAVKSKGLMINADLQGTFYIAGSFRENSKKRYQPFISKYSHSGQQIWKHLLPLPVDKAISHEEGFVPDALEVDNLSNVYVADWLRVGKELPPLQPLGGFGAFYVPNVNLLAITKYNPNGQQQWKYEHKADDKGIKLARTILFKTLTSGNVLCISLVEGPNFTADFHVINLTSDGNKNYIGIVSKPSDWPIVFNKK